MLRGSVSGAAVVMCQTDHTNNFAAMGRARAAKRCKRTKGPTSSLLISLGEYVSELHQLVQIFTRLRRLQEVRSSDDCLGAAGSVRNLNFNCGPTGPATQAQDG